MNTMQYRAAICDDIKYYVEEIKEYVEEFVGLEKKKIEITTYSDGADLMMDAKKCKYDIIFLDVDMPVLNGIETAKLIREFDTDAVLIFITSHESFSLQATQVEAMGYIVKPIDKDKLFRILKKALILIQGIQSEKQLEKQFMEIIVDYEKVPLNLMEIVFMQKIRNQMQVHMKSGKDYYFYSTVKNVMTMLPRNRFCRVSSSMIVNMGFVKELKAYKLSVRTEKECKEYPISRVFYKQLKQDYLLFQKNRR